MHFVCIFIVVFFLLIFLLVRALAHGVIPVLLTVQDISFHFYRLLDLVSVIDYYLQIDPANAAASQINREEVDSRSVFVGNVSCLFTCFC